MKKFRTLVFLGMLLLVVPGIAQANLQRPENIRVVVDEEQNQAKLFWSEYNSSGDIDGYQFELINEPAGSSEAYQIVEDLDGQIDNKGTLSLEGFAEDTLIKLRVKSLNATIGDSPYSQEMYLRKFSQKYTEDFESLDLGSVDNQNGWNTEGNVDFQIIDTGSEEGKALTNTTGNTGFGTNQTTQGVTGESAKIRIKTRRIDDPDYEAPVIWLHGQGDRFDPANITSPRYGLTIDYGFVGSELVFKAWDDGGNTRSFGMDYTGLSGAEVQDWHYIEFETFRIPGGLQLRGTTYNKEGELLNQINNVETNNWVTFDAQRGFYGISANYSTFNISKIDVWADDFRVPPSAPEEVRATPIEEGISFSWNASDLGGATSPEGKYLLQFEQVGGGVTQDYETTDTSYTFTDLNPLAQYRLTVQAVNAEYQSTHVTSANATPGADRTAPTISNQRITFVDNNTAAGSFRIQWSTSENTKGRVTYGFQEDSTVGIEESNFSFTNNTLGTSHSATLTKLAPCTKYRGRIRVRDAANNLTTTPIDFVTKGCVGNTEIEQESNDNVANTEEKEIELLDGSELQAKVRVPQNVSTKSSLNFQIKRLVRETFLENVEIPDTLQVIAEIVNLSALEDEDSNVSEFDKPIEITLAYDDTGLTPEEEQELVIYRYGAVEWFECEPSGDCIPDGEEGFEGTGDRDGFWTPGEEWEQLSDCNVDTNANTVTCNTTRFSSFTVMKLLGGGEETETPTQEVPSQEETNSDSSPQDISGSIPGNQPNTYTNRPFASLARAVSSRNLALNVIEEETSRGNNQVEDSEDITEQENSYEEDRQKRDDQNKVAEEISNIEQDLQENPRTRWYLGATVSGILLVVIALAWMSQRRKM